MFPCHIRSNVCFLPPSDVIFSSLLHLEAIRSQPLLCRSCKVQLAKALARPVLEFLGVHVLGTEIFCGRESSRSFRSRTAHLAVMSCCLEGAASLSPIGSPAPNKEARVRLSMSARLQWHTLAVQVVGDSS